MSEEPRTASSTKPTPVQIKRSSHFSSGHSNSNGLKSSGLPTSSRPSSSVIQSSSNLEQHTPSAAQSAMKEHSKDELRGATWEMSPVDLAYALSAKAWKHGVSFDENPHDIIENYDTHLLETLEPHLLASAEKLRQLMAESTPPVDFPDHGHPNEESSYQSINNFLQCCVAAALFASEMENGPGDHSYYSKLRFAEWAKPVSDGVGSDDSLKPDLVGFIPRETEDSSGAISTHDIPSKVSWTLSDAAREEANHCELLIPVEVKRSWSELIAQAATYARCLSFASPVRQFSLVLAYQYKAKELRFLVFHPGGLTASAALDPSNSEHHIDILRLFVALITWETRADAGLPEWCDETSSYLPLKGNDDGVNLRIEEVLHRSLALRGRSPEVWRLSNRTQDSADHPFIPPPVTSLTQGKRPTSSKRKATEEGDSQRKRKKKDTATQCGNVTQNSSAATKKPGYGKPVALKRFEARYVRQGVDTQPNQVFEDDIDIVSKFSWVSRRYFNAERNMLHDCGDSFGVAKHYYSSVVHHKEGLPVTNHLFLNLATFWRVIEKDDAWKKKDPIKEYRALRQHVSSFCGRSLVHVKTPEELFNTIAHAMIGYWNMLRKGYQHRDISIGNMLRCETAQAKASLSEVLAIMLRDINISDSRKALLKKLKDLLERLKIDDQCKGFVIDGDLAINLREYFFDINLSEATSRSGTVEFMSEGLITSVKMKEPYLQSPVDDVFSFFYSALWAAVYNGDYNELGLPNGLDVLRQEIASETRTRAVETVVERVALKANNYGDFLPKCQAFLRSWQAIIKRIVVDWAAIMDKDPEAGTLEEHFCTFYERSLLEYLELLIEMYPSGSE
ncbi:hypothetical protein CONPUDRAFT_137525 [Coniophora puteana RWD-64-598 SS2]|uniref:Fungal-type protein kinase domain-containing protein n=1 Tax=Coniophora puteana (strain RWD-64-598) TaxID=741705 RepID=A0A5M3MNL2_CONPW|nr:uncharacterized protein CONPUDRAFT_137525 [Coniophora puteana RWD-64-598 SS2]EIW80211.1 hypothetical protein CONPUDRAFT_137525 [Coniophora puteana RWD-64-598 SS2]